jgi:hypothetical protein
MNRLSLVTALGAALGVSCSEPTSQAPPQLNLDRPVDIAFACYGGMRVTNGRTTGEVTDEIDVTAQPATSCNTRSEPHDVALPEHVPPGQEDLSAQGGQAVGTAYWFGFILQSASGTVAIAQWPSKPAAQFLGGDVAVLDADPLTPGKNAISVGEDPIAIATDKAGCYEITANAGSCDLSELEINSALDDDPEVKVTRVAVQNAARTTILAKPAAMVAEPNTEVVGNVCPATATGVVYVAYPSCHLVAGIETSTGTIVSGIQYDAAGVPSVLSGTALATLSCPAECPDDKGTLGSITPGTRPVTLALELDPRAKTKRLVIGADNSASFTVVELGADSLPLSFSQIALSDPTGKLGITSIALSPRLGVGGTGGTINDDAVNQAQYVYAVATDKTVRVADVLTLNRECDTQIDSRFLRTVRSVSALQCLPVGDPTLPRRVGARGPGIELVGGGVPTSVAFFKAPPPEAELRDPAPAALVGYFAIITAANGASFVVNVDDDNNPVNTDLFQSSAPQFTAPTLTIAHQLRDNGLDRGAVTITNPAMEGSSEHSCLDFGPGPGAGGASVAGPRSTTVPVRTVVGGPVADNKVPELPGLRQVRCVGYDTPPSGIPVSQVQLAADLETRDQTYPDLRSLASDETWNLSWEGPLSADSNLAAIDGPQVREAVMAVDTTGMHLYDQAQPFCAMGAEPFDIVQFRGCNPANGGGDCPVGYECYLHPDSQVSTGSCMLRTEASRLATACRDFLTSRRRYTVGVANSGELMLLPRKHVLRTTPIDGCTDDLQCTYLANYAAQNASGQDPIATPVVEPMPDPSNPGKPIPDVNSRTWACRTDTARAAINPDPAKNKRCIETCTATADCELGTICQGGVCMEGITPPQSCVNGPQRFDVRASEAFTVIGSRAGYVHPIVNQGGACVRDPSASSLQLGRIPLQAPACGDPIATDPITGQISGGGFEANPCSRIVPQIENQPVYTDLANGTCTRGAPPDVLAERGAPAIQFRNPGLKLTIVDPYYPGDKVCLLDRQGALGRIPLVFEGYQLSFHQTAGYTPLTLPINPAFPVKVVRGPTDSIWVLDNGDFLSTSFNQPSTRGKVFRVESINLGAINLLQ